MNLRQTLFLALTCFLFTSTGNAKATAAYPSKIDPFTLEIPLFSGEISQEFKVDIDRDHGFVQYAVSSMYGTQIQLAQSQVTVTGCDSKQVVTHVMWFPQKPDAGFGYYVPKKGTFFLPESGKGILAISFNNLSYCTKLKYKISLKEIF